MKRILTHKVIIAHNIYVISMKRSILKGLGRIIFSANGRFDFYNQWLRSFENWLNSELIKKFSNKKYRK